MRSPLNELFLLFPRIAKTSSRWQVPKYRVAGLALRALWSIQGNLRAKFVIVIVALEIALMGAVTVVVERHQRAAILGQARLRALSLGSSLAALSEGYLLSYNFAKLEQAVERVTADEEDVLYTIAHLRDGKVAAFSGRNDLQGRYLDDPVSQRAVQAEAPLVQLITMRQTRATGYDVAVPVYVPEVSQKWGTIRLGVSLRQAHLAIHQTRRDLLLLSLGAVICGILLAILLATRILKPIGQLVSGVHEISRGSYDRPLQVDSRDEISYLAQAFEQMRTSLQLHLSGLTEEKQLLEEANTLLKESQRHLILMAAKVAHEINNPLAIIKTTFRLIRVQSREKEGLDEQLLTVEQEIDRIARIIQEVLVFARPSQQNEVVEIGPLIESLEPLLAHDLSRKRIALRMILQPGLPRVHISADRLKQVILNIVRNAEDAMPDGGQLVVQTIGKVKSVELSIADTGCGIPQTSLSRLFDPFFTTKGGMGLGLAISYEIIKAAGGAIEVESKVGLGTTFRVTLLASGA